MRYPGAIMIFTSRSLSAITLLNAMVLLLHHFIGI
jgi:hypothetical protein